MNDKKLIIFDMDGTLIDSSATIANAINHVRSHLGLENMPSEEILSKVNDPSIDPARFFYDIERFEPIHEQLFTQYYSQHHDKELRLYDGVTDLLRHLKTNGKLIAMATNAYHRSTIEALEHFGIADMFDDVVCADDVDEGKPAPDMLYKILDDLGVDKKDAVFVGDGPRDEEAARKAGIDYIMVDWGFTDHHISKEVITSTEELKQHL